MHRHRIQTWAVYGRYIVSRDPAHLLVAAARSALTEPLSFLQSSMNGLWRMPLFLATLVLAQGANVGTTILLGKWSESGSPGLGVPGWSRSDCESHLHPFGFHILILKLRILWFADMATYAGLGLAYSLISFCGTVLLFLSGTRASYNLFNRALDKVMRSPVGWHDQTPVGRIVSRLSKDILVMGQSSISLFLPSLPPLKAEPLWSFAPSPPAGSRRRASWPMEPALDHVPQRRRHRRPRV